MTAIAGVAYPYQANQVRKMLEIMHHRGPVNNEIYENDKVSLGMGWSKSQSRDADFLLQDHIARDYAGECHLAMAYPHDDGFFLKRDPLGVAPLYYGKNENGILYFASEVKALLPFTQEISELLPGATYDGNIIQTYFKLEQKNTISDTPEMIANRLLELLTQSVQRCLQNGEIGSWLSGGLDSSILAALARPLLPKLHTFTVGFQDSPDVLAARVVASALKTDHHEKLVTADQLIAILPEVIYHLESFDALLVRSSVTNYLVAKLASEYVPEVLSGEGGDELFGGYAYLKNLPKNELPNELLDITRRLHNTALQRVDRCASAHGTVAHVRFLDPDVVDYAFRIPSQYKIYQGEEKWILRKAVEGLLPQQILHRRKSKFWEGAGVTSHLEEYANSVISDRDFQLNRSLNNNWIINTKEEYLYYSIFKAHFGDLENLNWMGRTKGAPIQ